MTKIEIINEIKNVVMNNGGEVKHGQIRYFINENGDVMADHCTGRGKNINTVSKTQLENDLATVKMFVEKYYNTEVENDTEYVAETKATKKDIIMGLHKNNEVKCDLATAEALATEGFIIIDRYEDGVLYGWLNWYAISDELFDDNDDLFAKLCDGDFGYHDIDQVTDWYDMGYLKSIEYVGVGTWHGELDWDGILIDFCKRWDNKLNEAA